MQVRKQLYCALYTYARKRKVTSKSLSTVSDLISKQTFTENKNAEVMFV